MEGACPGEGVCPTWRGMAHVEGVCQVKGYLFLMVGAELLCEKRSLSKEAQVKTPKGSQVH